ncbi:hypothetical protein QTP70_021933 [Hemibagrus guttatus]|uniref:Peroxiredoxin-6 n=1 Tax=Hemibagrus guttatus TaxID=175788 RepID=A0AAE0QAA4_9TELE|nr:hypothetical protein QTP70_021933 [Hemibagrus guttatus]
MMDGLRCMQSSSGNCCPPPVDDVEALEEAEPLRRRFGLSEARRRAVVGSEPCLWRSCEAEEGESGGVRVSDMNSYRPLLPLPTPETLLLRPLLALTEAGRDSSIMPGVLLGDVFPNFEANTTIGKIKFHDFLGDSWGILFSHPRDFTPVCTTELASAARLSNEFKKRDVKMIALSIDSVADHCAWSKDVMALHSEAAANPLPFPIIADDKRELSVLLGMLDPDERDKDGMPLTARCVFVIGPDKRLKLSILYPATTGRNFTEILRVIDSLQLTANKKVATPVDWKPGEEVMVIPSLSDEEAKKLFPAGFTTKELPSGKKYLRYTPQP